VDGLAVVADESRTVVAVGDALADLLTAIAAEFHDLLSLWPIYYVLSCGAFACWATGST
jgi:phosphoglycolate phosphatase-like HAD superfamily hydrolase